MQVEAKLDTGASFCIFERAYGEILGLNIEDGERTDVSTANGTFAVFGHWVTLRPFALNSTRWFISRVTKLSGAMSSADGVH